jgi:simple sugar transport system permease protein
MAEGFRFERNPAPKAIARAAAPLLAALAMTLTLLICCLAMDLPPLRSLQTVFITPLATAYGIGEWLLKATPLMLCALGLALGFRANVWNIGAEGQLTLGAITGGGVALYIAPGLGVFGLPAVLLAGMLGGMAWAAIPAFLRTRFHTSEILTSLMLVYVAQLLLSFLMHGHWQDPEGFNFPQSRAFEENLILPLIANGQRATIALFLALALAVAAWIFVRRTWAGFGMLVAGAAPAAARYAGLSANRSIWWGMLISGAAAGLAGITEVAGPIGRLQTSISPGYGFAAIIVAFVGRLHPLGIVLAALLMSLLYLGGEAAQLSLGLPSAVTGLMQGLLLFYLLAAEWFTGWRLVRTPVRVEVVA